MKYTFKKTEDLDSFENFVKSNGGQYLQSSKWAQVKLEWQSSFFAGFDGDGNMVLTALIMARKIPGVGKLWYSPAGPVCDYHNRELLIEFSDFIKKEASEAGAFAYFIDPCEELRVNGEKLLSGVEIHKNLCDCGFVLNPDASECLYKSPLQLILKLRDENGDMKKPESLLKSFDKGIRYSVRIGENRGLTEKVYEYSDIENNPEIMEDFLAVMRDTSERNDFVERGGDYCKRLMKVFSNGEMDIMLIYYDKAKDAALQNERLIKKQELLELMKTAPEKKLRGIKDEIESIDKQTAHFEERVRETALTDKNLICVAGGMTIHYNGMSSCLFGGARNLLRNNLRASHYFNFRRILRSIEKQNTYHDLGYVLLKNVPPDDDGVMGKCVPNDDFVGICEFKKSFGSDYIEYIGEYVLPVSQFGLYSYKKLLPKARKAQSVVNRIIRKRR